MKKYKHLAAVLLITLISTAAMAAPFGVGSSIGVLKGYKYEDQHEKPQTIHPDTRTLILTFEKGTGAFVNEYISKQDKAYLSRHKIQYIADISGMPGFATTMFALPKMRKYQHTILLNYEDDFPDKIPHQEEKVTVVQLDEKQNVTAMLFVEEEEAALESALTGQSAPQ